MRKPRQKSPCIEEVVPATRTPKEAIPSLLPGRALALPGSSPGYRQARALPRLSPSNGGGEAGLFARSLGRLPGHGGSAIRTSGKAAQAAPGPGTPHPGGLGGYTPRPPSRSASRPLASGRMSGSTRSSGALALIGQAGGEACRFGSWGAVTDSFNRLSGWSE